MMTNTPAHPMPDADAIALAKRQTRQRVRASLASMSEQQRCDASRAACLRIASMPAFIKAQTVMLYLPLAGEADCTLLLAQCLREGRPVCVPRVDWSSRTIDAVSVASLEEGALTVDEHGLRVPRDGRAIAPRQINVVIVPALAFDERGRRLGRSGGFYDRFLARLPASALTIGLAFERQIVEDLPIAPHDVAVRMVATERRLIGGRP